jgi:hypothetical protein
LIPFLFLRYIRICYGKNSGRIAEIKSLDKTGKYYNVKLIGIPGVSVNGQASVSKGRIDEYRANNLILTVAEKNTIEGLEKGSKKEKVESIIGKYFRCHQGIYSGRVACVNSKHDRTYSVYIVGEYKRTTMTNALAAGKMDFLISVSDVS